MKRNVSSHMPTSVLRSLEQFGADIRIARLKRNLTAAQLASALQVHRTTLSRVEAGDPMVALGIYAGVLHALGLVLLSLTLLIRVAMSTACCSTFNVCLSAPARIGGSLCAALCSAGPRRPTGRCPLACSE